MTSARRLAVEVLMAHRPEDLTADQLAKVAAAWVGELVQSTHTEDASYMEACGQAVSVCLAEFVRRSRDLDPMVPRTEEVWDG